MNKYDIILFSFLIFIIIFAFSAVFIDYKHSSELREKILACDITMKEVMEETKNMNIENMNNYIQTYKNVCVDTLGEKENVELYEIVK